MMETSAGGTKELWMRPLCLLCPCRAVNSPVQTPPQGFLEQGMPDLSLEHKTRPAGSQSPSP